MKVDFSFFVVKTTNRDKPYSYNFLMARFHCKKPEKNTKKTNEYYDTYFRLIDYSQLRFVVKGTKQN